MHENIRMKRKVQQLGSSTLAVTVPSEWADYHGIEKGDELLLQRDENGGSLLVIPDSPSDGEGEATVDADALDADALRRAVVSQYVLGRQLITVESEQGLLPEQYDAVADAEHELMGLGVVEETATRIAVRCSVAPSDFELPTLLARLGRTERTMRTEALDALIDDDPTAARRLLSRERQIKKLFYLFLRLLFATYRNPRLNQSVGIGTGFPLIGYRSVAQDTLLMADAACDVARLVDDGAVGSIDERTAHHLRTLSDAVDQVTEIARDAVANPDYETTVEARDARATVDDIVTTVEQHLETDRPADALALQRVVIALERCARHATDTLDVATHLAFHEASDVETGG